jgi:VWFA-related protein
MHSVGNSSREITFRDGKEIQDPLAGVSADPNHPKTAQQELGLHTWGEFGPELAVILTDLAKGSVSFHHWEQASTGLLAVYRYSVPRVASHYAVSYCCLRETPITILRQSGGRRDATVVMPSQPGPTVKPFSETPGYHGSLSIDPATGAILRITLEAELGGGDPLLRAATVVEYGRVAIGNNAYICPVRSLAFSMEESNANGAPGDAAPSTNKAARQPTLLLNETSFTHYHRLGATVRVLADASLPPPPSPASTDPSDSTSANPSAPALNPSVTASTTSSSPPSPQASDASPGDPLTAPTIQTQAEVAPTPTPPSPAEPYVPEISLSAANGVPDQPVNTAPPSDTDFQLKLSSRLVDVGIVAYDKKGHPVKDLKAEDFEIYDNGRKQDVRFFNQFASEGTALDPDPATAQTFSNRPSGAGSSPSAATDAGATVLLIDENHIAWPDLSHARQEILKFLGTVPPGERIGLYTMTPIGFRILQEITTNHASLIARLQKWMPTAQSAVLAQEEETRNRQSFNEVHSTADLNSVNGNQIDVPDAGTTVDPALRTMGSNPARASLIILNMVARHLSGLTGHKNLVWVSSDNVFADWQSNQVAIDKSPKQVDSFAMHAQEAMNDAHVAVFPMDVSQLESAAINADIRTRNVELNQAAADMASQNGGSVANDLTPGRAKAEMQQDMHPIQGPIRMVADATGGRVIRRAGDLASELASVVEAGHATYLVSFSPQGPADDQFHTISIKLSSKQHGLTLRYRTGYLYAREPASLKDRFQQAVWRPRDVSEVSVTAGLASMNAGSNVKVEIAASDLALQQQAGRWMDKLDIFFIQRDDAGLHAQVEGQTLGLRLKSSTYQNLMSAGVPFEHFVQMKPGMASLRVLVVDENSGRMGSITIPGPALAAAK